MNTDQHKFLVGTILSLGILLSLAQPTSAGEAFTIEQYDEINAGKRFKIEANVIDQRVGLDGKAAGSSIAMPWQFPLTTKFMKWGCFDQPFVFGHLLADHNATSVEKIYYFDGPRFLR